MLLHKKVVDFYKNTQIGKINIDKIPLTKEIQDYFTNEILTTIDIRSHLRRLFTKKTHYFVMTCKNITISYIPTKGLTQKKIKLFMHHLSIVANMFKIVDNIYFILLLCDIPRTFPENGEQFDKKHINGAYIYPNIKTAFVYRLDDFEKVAIHELLHVSVLHTHEMFYNEYMHPNEAVIESWATMIYMSLYSIEHNIPFRTLYNNEIRRRLSLSHQLLRYQEKYMRVWNENTPAYSYIRLCTCIMVYWNKFYKIPYPYDANRVEEFLLKHNNSDELLKKIRFSNLLASLTIGLK